LEDGAFFLELEALAAEDVVVAPNGAALPTPTAAALRTVRQYLGPQPFAPFVSSAHPPNASGLMHMIHDAPGLRLRHGVVIVCGDVARLLQPMSADPALQHLFRDVRLLGRVPGDDLLAAFYAQAHVAIIPCLLGGAQTSNPRRRCSRAGRLSPPRAHSWGSRDSPPRRVSISPTIPSHFGARSTRCLVSRQPRQSSARVWRRWLGGKRLRRW
jgi:hypothetical protein